MSSRIAKVTMLAVASLMLSSGAAFGASALSTSTNASSVQYGTGAKNAPQSLGGSNPSPPPVQNVQQVLGETDEGSVAPVRSAGNGPGPDVAGVAAAQAPRQLAAASGSDASRLPFTGLAVIPILLSGVALLALGLVLRRRGATSDVPV